MKCIIKWNYGLFALAWYENLILQYVTLLFHNVLFAKFYPCIVPWNICLLRSGNLYLMQSYISRILKLSCVLHRSSLHINKNHFGNCANPLPCGLYSSISENLNIFSRNVPTFETDTINYPLVSQDTLTLLLIMKALTKCLRNFN